MAKKPRYYEIGTIRRDEGGEWDDGTPRPARSYIAITADTDKNGDRDISGLKALRRAVDDLIDDPKIKGVYFDVEDPEVKFKRLCEYEHISEDKRDELIEGIPKWLKRRLKFVVK